jgi:hypothetical protein
MLSVPIQLRRKLVTLVNQCHPVTVIRKDDSSTGVIHYQSDSCNYLDKKVFYKWECSSSNFDAYKLFITCDWDGVFNQINGTTYEVKT